MGKKIFGSFLLFGGGAAIYYSFDYESKLLAFVGAFMWMMAGNLVHEIKD